MEKKQTTRKRRTTSPKSAARKTATASLAKKEKTADKATDTSASKKPEPVTAKEESPLDQEAKKSEGETLEEEAPASEEAQVEQSSAPLFNTPAQEMPKPEPKKEDQKPEKTRQEKLMEPDKKDQLNKFVTGGRKKNGKDVLPAKLDPNTERFYPAIDQGLSDKQVHSRIEAGLSNNTHDSNEKTYSKIILENVLTFFNLLCLVVAVVLFIFKKYTQCTFLLVAIINTVIGIVQEIRSKMTVDKLKLITAQNVKTLRNGKTSVIPAEELVLDDIYILNTGDQIPADSILMDGAIEVNESLLTGESLPVKKKKGDKIFAGSFVVSGSAIVQAESIGQYNYANTIQSKAKEVEKSHSELMSGLDKIIKIISIIIIPLSALLFYTQWHSHADPGSLTYIADGWQRASEAVSRTAGSIISMIPAGMYLLTSIALAVGVMSLAKKNTLVQDLYCIEMLARVNTLCLDKTGTLTDGTMRCAEVLVIDPGYDLKALMGSYLNSFKESNQTSIAMMSAYPLRSDYHPKKTIPFSSARKYSAVTFYEEGTYIFGAPEYIYDVKDRTVQRYIANKQAKGYRVVMICHCDKEIEGDEISGKVTPIAVFALEDHIRKEAPDTIKWFTDNGVEIKIISGDNPLTVSEIAKKCNVPHAEKCISLEGLSVNDVDALVEEYTVFGRVSPEQKAEIIRVLKSKGHTVGMTGDGVNDILAMKQSDCSIAMANGASAARNVAHLVLLDSNFASLPAVVREGRRVVNNIQRSSSLFLMKTIFTMIFTTVVLISSIGGGIAYPFTTSNMIIMESCIIGLASFFLALQKNDALIEGHFMSNTLARAVPAGVTLALVIGLNYILRYFAPGFLDLTAVHDDTLTLEAAGMAELAFTSFNVLSMIVVSLAMLLNTCLPFNRYRRILFFSITGLVCFLIFVTPYIPNLFPVPDTLTNPYIAEHYNFASEFFGFDFRSVNKTMWLLVFIYAFSTPKLIELLINFISPDKSNTSLYAKMRNRHLLAKEKKDLKKLNKQAD